MREKSNNLDCLPKLGNLLHHIKETEDRFMSNKELCTAGNLVNEGANEYCMTLKVRETMIKFCKQQSASDSIYVTWIKKRMYNLSISKRLIIVIYPCDPTVVI